MPGKFTKGPTNPVYIDDAKIIFPWFSGKQTPMNREGDRNFGLILTREQADQLSKDGYNVKSRRPKDPETQQPDMTAEETLYVKCKINFNSNKPPRVILVTCIDGVCKRTPMDDTNITLLDTADVEKVDCKFRPYDREESNTRTAYVDQLFVTVNLDKYDIKYNDVPWDGAAADAVPHDAAAAHDSVMADN